MKRILIVHPQLDPPGGGNAVGAWAIQALRDSYEISLVSWRPAHIDLVNRYWGTTLREGDFEEYLIDGRIRRLVDSLPTPSGLLRLSLLQRFLFRTLKEQRFDRVLSTANEFDFGGGGIQYIHFPTSYLPRPDCDLRWYHRIPAGLTSYRNLCNRISGASIDGIRRNLSLVNSDWTGRHVTKYFGCPTKTLYPPVAGEFPHVPWRERGDEFVCIGRISPEKELEKTIEIVRRIRAAGHAVRLRIVGNTDSSRYAKRFLRFATRHREFVSLEYDLSREELVDRVSRSRYGLHGMVGEHFGIGVAELQRAGCIVFVPAEGGPAEVVGHDPRLLYRDADEAVERIVRVLSDPACQRSILAGVAERRDWFSVGRFVSELRRVVDACDPPDG